MNKHYLLILINFIILGCTKNNPTATNKVLLNHNFVLSKTVSVPISNRVNYKSWQIHPKTQNDSSYIVRKNYYDNSVLVYNWDSKRLLNTYKFKDEGPNEVVKFDSAAFLEIATDSFLVANAYSQIYIIKNDSILFKNTYDDVGGGFGNLMNGFNKNLPVKLDDDVFIFRKPSVEITNDLYYAEHLLVKFNLKTKILKALNVHYPDSYIKGQCWNFPALRQSFTRNNLNQLVFSFPIDPNLYVYHIEKDTLTTKQMPNYNKLELNFIPCDDNLSQTEYLYSVKNNSIYHSITYDRYKDIYYRVLLSKPKNLTKDNVEELQQTISLIALDNNFNIIAEKTLANNTYDFNDFFVTKEGFWLSKNNINSETFDENFMSFDLFNVQKQ